MKKNVYIVVIIITIILGFSGYYFLLRKSLEEMSYPFCLVSGEQVLVEINKIKDAPSEARVLIVETDSGKEIFSFLIENIIAGHYNAYEVHKCGMYTMRMFNYDYQRGEVLPDFSMEIWRYHYDGSGEKLLESNDFRVNPSETFIVTMRGYFGSSDYVIVIKDLETLNDVFVLSIAEIERQNPDIVGDMQLENWSKNGRYLWANTAYGANTLGLIRIDTQDWSVDLLPAPKDVLGGDAVNLENGYITVHPGNIWFGVAQLTEEEKAKRRIQGIGTELYIENLFTKERRFIDKTDEPLWYFKPKWLSDTELEYYLPSGERRVYTVENEN